MPPVDVLPGNLLANALAFKAVVGVLAEWIVARLLKPPIRTRPPYATYDLETASGRSIEVKAAAYLQGWDQKRLSRITFSTLSNVALGGEHWFWA
jgi:hypothetical protein